MFFEFSEDRKYQSSEPSSSQYTRTHHYMLDEVYVNSQLLLDLDEILDPDKFLWVAENADVAGQHEQLKNIGFEFPALEHNMRNCKKIQDGAGIEANTDFKNFPQGQWQCFPQHMRQSCDIVHGHLRAGCVDTEN